MAKDRDWRDTSPMAVARDRPAGRVWFVDPESPERRMSVSTHLEDGVVLVSLWSGQRCTGSFKMPLTDAPRLIGALADAKSSCPAPRHPALQRHRRDAMLAWARERIGLPARRRRPRLRLLK